MADDAEDAFDLAAVLAGVDDDDSESGSESADEHELGGNDDDRCRSSNLHITESKAGAVAPLKSPAVPIAIPRQEESQMDLREAVQVQEQEVLSNHSTEFQASAQQPEPHTDLDDDLQVQVQDILKHHSSEFQGGAQQQEPHMILHEDMKMQVHNSHRPNSGSGENMDDISVIGAREPSCCSVEASGIAEDPAITAGKVRNAVFRIERQVKELAGKEEAAPQEPEKQLVLSNLEDFRKLSQGRTSLNLQDLQLRSIAPLGLESLSALRSLSLAGNHLTEAPSLQESLSHLVGLTELDISRCRLKSLPLLEHNSNLTHFNASENLLTSSRGLVYCMSVRFLLLAHNRLKRVDQLETLQNLEELDVSHNRLGPTAQAAMRNVAACARLQVLRVKGNPFAEVAAHRAQLTNLIPSLLVVDDRKLQTGVGRRSNSVGRGAGYAFLAKRHTANRQSPKSAPRSSSAIHSQPLKRSGFSSVSLTAMMQSPASTAYLSERQFKAHAGNPLETPLPTRLRRVSPFRGSSAKQSRTTHIHSEPIIHRYNVDEAADVGALQPKKLNLHLSSPTQKMTLMECIATPSHSIAPMPSTGSELATASPGNLEASLGSLNHLLEEKRRLMSRVSARLNAGASEKSPIDTSSMLPTTTEGTTIESFVGATPCDMSLVTESGDQPHTCQDLRSLCTSLRDCIERKRALLHKAQLQIGKRL